MKELFDKLSSYNIFNYLFPGILFCILSKEITGYNLLQNDIATGVFYYYFVGLVISKIGSVVVEPILKNAKFVVFSKYSDFIDASKKEPKIELFSEINNMYRTLISMIFLLIALRLYNILENTSPDIIKLRWICLTLFLFILFLFSYRKQTKYIANRVKHIAGKESDK